MPEGTDTNSREAERFFLSGEQPAGAGSLLRDDAQIREDVSRNLARDPWVNDQAVLIEVQEGVVTLNGELDVPNQKIAAGEDAWEVPGVRDVRNNISVRRPKGMDRRERVAQSQEAAPSHHRR